MTDITRLSQFVNGVLRGVDLTTNNVVTGTVTVGGGSGTTLTKAILDNLVNLQNGTDFSTGTNSHTHDGRYYTQNQVGKATASAGSTLVGDDNSYSHFTPTAATVKGALEGIDAALSSAGISALTGDVTASGSGSVAATVAAIQGTTVSGTTGTGNVMFSASPTTTGTLTAAAISASGNISSSGGTVSGTNLTTGGHASADLALSGGTMSGAIAMGNHKITGLAAPTANGDALRFDQLGAANGIATLDSGGKIPLSQLTSSVMRYLGAWDASTNTPTLADGTGTTGDLYRASVAGTQDLGSGSQTWAVGDLVIYNGTIWQHSPAADGVSSVNGNTGAVTVNAINQLSGDVTTSAASQSQSKAATVAAIQGTTVSGTTGTGNVMFSASPTTTGTLTAAAISASGSITGSNLSGTNTGDQTITLTGDVTGSGTGSFAATIGAGKVTATKLGTVTDGVTLDQSGAGSTLEIKSGGVGTTQLAATSVTAAKLGSDVAGSGLAGGNGSALTVAWAPQLQTSQTAGVAFAANTSFIVRWALTGETAGRVYKADQDATTTNNFYAVGIAQSTGSVSVGGSISVVSAGTLTLGSSDTPFSSGDVGKPVFLTTSGAFSTTAPTTTNSAVMQVGIVQSTSSIWVQPQFNGIN